MDSTNMLTLADVRRWRDTTYRRASERRLKSAEEAVAFVNEVGFCFFWPIEGAELPSLWDAVAGDRPVPNDHDDPGHVTWGWKRSEEHTSELQSRPHLVCRLLL